MRLWAYKGREIFINARVIHYMCNFGFLILWGDVNVCVCMCVCVCVCVRLLVSMCVHVYVCKVCVRV
jgi:hypothetical protein